MPEVSVKEAVRFYVKQLKLPTFAHLEETAGKFRTGDSLESFVLALMKREYDARQEKTRKDTATPFEEGTLSLAQDAGRIRSRAAAAHPTGICQAAGQLHLH